MDRKPELERGEWEVVRFYRLAEGEKLMVLLTPAGEWTHSDRAFPRWAQWAQMPRSKFGDHILGVRIKV
jgi:hypothetical protein